MRALRDAGVQITGVRNDATFWEGTCTFESVPVQVHESGINAETFASPMRSPSFATFSSCLLGGHTGAHMCVRLDKTSTHLGSRKLGSKQVPLSTGSISKTRREHPPLPLPRTPVLSRECARNSTDDREQQRSTDTSGDDFFFFFASTSGSRVLTPQLLMTPGTSLVLRSPSRTTLLALSVSPESFSRCETSARAIDQMTRLKKTSPKQIAIWRRKQTRQPQRKQNIICVMQLE